MRKPRQYLRALKLVYGEQDNPNARGPDRPFTITSKGGDNVRVAFVARRNNKGEADTCTIDIYNLSKEDRESMEVDRETQWRRRLEVQQQELDTDERARKLKELSDAYRINLFAGYGDPDTLPLMFRGDLLDVVPVLRRGQVDTITRIKLGDTLLALRDSYMSQVFQAGTRSDNIIRAGIASMGLDAEKGAKAFLSAVGPNATFTKMENGWYAVGRSPDTIDEFVDLFGLQWWIRDGVIYFVSQGATLQDLSIELVEGRDLLDWNESGVYGDFRGKALLNSDIVPGRGLILRVFGEQTRAEGQKSLRVATAIYQGDTHGAAWWVTFEAQGVDTRVISSNKEFIDRETAADQRLVELERQAAL